MACFSVSVTERAISTAEAQTLSTSNISDHSTRTRTPIKHLIVVIGENRSFDNVFATFIPADPKQSVRNLLSQGIVDKTGAPGLNAAKALQRQATEYASEEAQRALREFEEFRLEDF